MISGLNIPIRHLLPLTNALLHEQHLSSPSCVVWPSSKHPTRRRDQRWDERRWSNGIQFEVLVRPVALASEWPCISIKVRHFIKKKVRQTETNQKPWHMICPLSRKEANLIVQNLKRAKMFANTLRTITGLSSNTSS